MANQANTSMADSLHQQIQDKHDCMVLRLSKYIHPGLRNWEELWYALSTFLDPVNLQGKDDSFMKICDKLMDQEIIDYGYYDKLYEVIKKIDAGQAKIIQQTSDEIKVIMSKGLPEATRPKTGVGDQTKGQPQAKGPRTDEGVGQQQSTEYSPKIAAMIERTKAMIEEDKKRTFIATKGFQDAKEKLHKNQVVVIKGNTGDGKTTTAIRLILGLIEEQQGRQPLQLHNIKDLDSLPPKSKLITFIDDIFGEIVAHEKDVGEWNKRINSVLPMLRGDKDTEANFLLITIRNVVFNSLRSHSLRNVFVDSNIIDLSSNDYKLKGEKLELLELYKPKKEENDLPVEILQMDQQSIQLYRKCLEEKEEEDYRLRVIVIGQTEVGKTTLTRNLLRLPQIIPHTKSTDGVDIHNSFVNLDDKDWITDADMQHGGKCMDARLIQSLQSIASENTGADPNTEGDKSAQTASNSDDVSFSSGEFDNDDQQNAGHARPIQSPNSTAFKKAGADPDDLKKLGPSTPANSNESVLKTLRNLMKGPLADRDYTRLGELSVWDFAGQFVFYTTHHTFLTHRAVYLLVTRLDQNINDTVGNDQCFLDATGCKEMKIKDFVSYWMNSVHLYSGAAEHLPPVILVGTHLDKVEVDIEKKTETYFEDLRRYLLDMESPTSSHLIDTDYAVSNPPNKLEIGNLRKKIVELASKQAYWGEKIPAKWITLEKALMEKKIEGVNIMSYDNVVDLDKSTGVPIDDQEKLDLFLRFQHAKGNMIYFSEGCLRDHIVINPQWLIDAFKCIITAPQFCTKNPALVKHWKALDKTGKLYLGLVDEIFRREDKFCRHKEHILGLMERLHIISHQVVDKHDDKNNTSEDFYFVPSLLKDKVIECEIENYVKGTNGTPYLCYVFENNFLPTAVFHRLIAACLSEYTVAKQGSKFLIFCGCGIFDLNGGLTRLVVAFYDSVIQIGLFWLSEGGCAPETSTCVSVRQFVTETLERVLRRYDMKLPFTLNLKCEKSHHLSHEGLLSVDVITGDEKVVCDDHEKKRHIINRDSLLHLWFPDKVSATDPNQGEVDGGPPMTNVAGACARTHQMAVTGTTLGRDQETYLCDSVGWQFYLDYLASKLAAEISKMSVYLGLESAKWDEIKIRCKSNLHEMCFNVLWTWYGRNLDRETRMKQMSTALNDSDRADLAKELMEGKVPVPENYLYHGEIKNPDAGVSSSDARKVGKYLTLTCQSLARYFGLDENNIQCICIDNNDDIQEQSYNTIMACIEQLKLKNRRQLCNGLAYLEQVTTVSELNQMW